MAAEEVNGDGPLPLWRPERNGVDQADREKALAMLRERRAELAEQYQVKVETVRQHRQPTLAWYSEMVMTLEAFAKRVGELEQQQAELLTRLDAATERLNAAGRYAKKLKDRLDLAGKYAAKLKQRIDALERRRR
jgi:DNA repair ATPase RecN